MHPLRLYMDFKVVTKTISEGLSVYDAWARRRGGVDGKLIN